MKNNKLLLIKPLISCLLLLTILTFSIYTFGWFSNSSVVNAGLSSKINQEPVSATPFTTYFFDEEEHTVKAVYSGPVELPAYDTVFTEKNTMNSIIYRIPVFGKVLETGQPFDITLNLKSLMGEDNILSDVIFVRAMPIAELQNMSMGEVSPEEIYSTAREHLTDLPMLTFFNNDGEKIDSITLTISDYTSPDSSCLNIYMEIGYDPVLINNWLVKNNMTISSDLVGSLDNLISLYGDIDTFVFSAHE